MTVSESGMTVCGISWTVWWKLMGESVSMDSFWLDEERFSFGWFFTFRLSLFTFHFSLGNESCLVRTDVVASVWCLGRRHLLVFRHSSLCDAVCMCCCACLFCVFLCIPCWGDMFCLRARRCAEICAELVSPLSASLRDASPLSLFFPLSLSSVLTSHITSQTPLHILSLFPFPISFSFLFSCFCVVVDFACRPLVLCEWLVTNSPFSFFSFIYISLLFNSPVVSSFFPFSVASPRCSSKPLWAVVCLFPLPVQGLSPFSFHLYRLVVKWERRCCNASRFWE